MTAYKLQSRTQPPEQLEEKQSFAKGLLSLQRRLSDPRNESLLRSTKLLRYTLSDSIEIYIKQRTGVLGNI